ncbi:FGGY-family carbohydrate kinase [Microlunatus flavus]|uniref:Xylulokinase n=1 Tax=Microlunatus flavus TaxID=1036181 RepID=A0A1H9ARP0_9ACTN|nr:FGGY family carbohydrate kinase [Microlunatus flavus]SEP79191.1 xylulokinase [Microlunatus flavus]
MSTVGLDLGTTGVRAVAFDGDGRELASAAIPTRRCAPRPGWLEVDAEAVLRDAEAVLADVARRAAEAGDPVRAVGFSSQGEAVVPVDAAGRALAGVPLGLDARGARAAAALAARLGADRVQELTGQPSHRMFSVGKIAEGGPAWRTPAVVGYRTLADFVAGRLGAPPAVDWTGAARTGMFDVSARTWSGEVLGATALDAPWLEPGRLSPPVAPGTDLGPFHPGVADRLGLARSTRLVAGMHDQAASYVGAGGSPGAVSVYALGSSDCLAVGTTTRPQGLGGTGFATYPWREDRWLTLAGSATGGLAVEWCAELLRSADVEALVAEASASPSPVLVLPYLAGSGTLDNDPDVRGSVVGLTLATTRADVQRAFLEASGFELGVLLEAFLTVGVVAGDLRAVGTGATSPVALGARADAGGTALTPAPGRSSARGAALLAAAALGAVDLDHLPPPVLGEPRRPVPATAGWYARQRRAYRALALTLRSFEHEHGAVARQAPPCVPAP